MTAKKITRKKAAPKKAASKSALARKSAARRAAKKKLPSVRVANHRFAPGTKVGVHPAASVGVERSAGREPFGTPLKTAKVKPNGVLEVNGLPSGQFCAVGQVGESYRYMAFSVK